MEKTKVFISWSQERSKYIAETVQWWLRQVVQASEPWVSSTDIDAGTRSMKEIETSLANTTFGIICVTPENVERPWLNYEAGALSKQVDEVATRVVPLLFGFADKADITTPVGQFHAVLADKDGFEQIAQSLNKCLAPELQRSTEDVRSSHLAFWGELESRLKGVPTPMAKIATPSRSSEDMFREIVNTVRELDGKIDGLLFTDGPGKRAGRDSKSRSVTRDFILEGRGQGDSSEEAEASRVRKLVRSVVSPILEPRRVSVDLFDNTIRIGAYRDLSNEEEEELANLVFDKVRGQGYRIQFMNHGLTHIRAND